MFVHEVGFVVIQDSAVLFQCGIALFELFILLEYFPQPDPQRRVVRGLAVLAVLAVNHSCTDGKGAFSKTRARHISKSLSEARARHLGAHAQTDGARRQWCTGVGKGYYDLVLLSDADWAVIT